MTKKRGLPRQLEENDDDEHREETFLEFAQEFFGTPVGTPQSGYPSLEVLKDKFSTRSACIRYLYNLDPRPERIKDIAKHMNTRYQHVRNVVTTPLKRGANEDWTKPYHPTEPPNED